MIFFIPLTKIKVTDRYKNKRIFTRGVKSVCKSYAI